MYVYDVAVTTQALRCELFGEQTKYVIVIVAKHKQFYDREFCNFHMRQRSAKTESYQPYFWRMRRVLCLPPPAPSATTKYAQTTITAHNTLGFTLTVCLCLARGPPLPILNWLFIKGLLATIGIVVGVYLLWHYV